MSINWFRTGKNLLFALTGLALGACEPVVPLVQYEEWDFEGVTVYSHVPTNPVGVVYLFHGSYGGARFATKIEVVDATNELVKRGYAIVATESTLRTGTKRWEVSNPSLSSNADLARIVGLHDNLINSSALTWQTPMFGIGMSNGARMVSLFGQTFSDAGYPIAAVAPFMGKVAQPVRSAGGMRIPTFFVIAENDTVASNTGIAIDYEMALHNGVAASLLEKPEEPLSSVRFTRIPTIDLNQAEQIRDALYSTGAWDADGERLLPLEETITGYSGLTLPAELTPDTAAIRNQIEAMLAMHQFVGFYKAQLADYFDENLPD